MSPNYSNQLRISPAHLRKLASASGLPFGDNWPEAPWTELRMHVPGWTSSSVAGRVGTPGSRSKAARQASPWVEWIARFGYAAKGVGYVVMGVLAVLAAAGAGGGSTTDQNGAFQTIEEAPFGQVLLGVVAVGLVGYVLWRSIQAVADPDGEGTDLKGVVKRIGYAGAP